MSCFASRSSICGVSLSNAATSNPNCDNWLLTFAAVALAVRSFALSFIPGAGQISISRSMIRMFSFRNSSNTPSCSLLDTRAITFNPSFDNCPSAIPKFPDVASITVWPDLSFPLVIAS